MSNLTFRLASGRVLLLHEPLTPEELEEAQSPAGMAVLEAVADRIAKRATLEVQEGHPDYERILREHGIDPKKE